MNKLYRKEFTPAQDHTNLYTTKVEQDFYLTTEVSRIKNGLERLLGKEAKEVPPHIIDLQFCGMPVSYKTVTKNARTVVFSFPSYPKSYDMMAKKVGKSVLNRILQSTDTWNVTTTELIDFFMIMFFDEYLDPTHDYFFSTIDYNKHNTVVTVFDSYKLRYTPIQIDLKEILQIHAWLDVDELNILNEYVPSATTQYIIDTYHFTKYIPTV